MVHLFSINKKETILVPKSSISFTMSLILCDARDKIVSSNSFVFILPLLF